MKKTLTILTFLIIGQITAQTKDLAKVKRMEGKEIYILCEPLRQYELLDQRIHQRTARMFQKDGAGKQTISTKMETFVRKLKKASEKDGFDFDAILYNEGKFAYPIKFTEEPTEENKGIGKVTRVNGMHVFVMNDPLVDFSIVDDKRHKVQMKSALSFGWSKNSIREDVAKFTKRFRKQLKKGEIDAFYYSYGNRANSIKFDN